MSDLPQVRLLDKTSPPHIATLILLSGLQAMAMNIFLPSLPSMGAHFGTTAAIMGLSVGAYLATSAVIQVLIGPVADNIGRRPVILGSLVVFCLGTLGCIYAPNLTVFMLCRMVQAVAVVGMVMGRAVVRDMVPMEEAGSRIAYVTMGMAVVPMLAPALGGVLDQSLGWQANFWLLLLAGLALFALAWMDLGETGTQRGITMMQQFREYPELLRSQRFWGYCMAGAFAGGCHCLGREPGRRAPLPAGRSFPISAARPSSGPRSTRWSLHGWGSTSARRRSAICWATICPGG
ncbi:MAG: MFS transporter [Rhodosalinus sp.]